MQIIPMEDFVLQQADKALKFHKFNPEFPFPVEYSEFTPENHVMIAYVTCYAKFLKLPLKSEYFNGPEPIVKIDGYQVLQPVDGKTNKDLTNIGLLLMNDDDNPIALAPNSTFRVLAGFPGAKLTKHGVKLIFG